MQGKSLNAILLAIVAVLALALAVTSIFLFTTVNNKETSDEEIDQTVGNRSVPADEQAETNLYAVGSDDTSGKAGEAVFNLKSTEKNPNSFIMVSISIIYDAGDKKALLEQHKQLLESTYLSELKQATIEYFRGKSFEELQSPDAMEQAREALKDIYNGIISPDPEEQIILRIVFDRWIIQ